MCEWAIQALTDATQTYYITLEFREKTVQLMRYSY